MLKRIPNIYYELLAAVMVVGCLVHPASSAAALLIILGSKAAEKYFTRNISDADRSEIQALKTEVQKLKTKSDNLDFGKALRGN